MTKQKTQAMKKLLLSLLLYATRSGGFAISQHRKSAFSMRNTCAITYKFIILCQQNQLVMGNRAAHYGDCKSPYSTPADGKSAGTGVGIVQ